jgi:hypothetical protein
MVLVGAGLFVAVAAGNIGRGDPGPGTAVGNGVGVSVGVLDAVGIAVGVDAWVDDSAGISVGVDRPVSVGRGGDVDVCVGADVLFGNTISSVGVSVAVGRDGIAVAALKRGARGTTVMRATSSSVATTGLSSVAVGVSITTRVSSCSPARLNDAILSAKPPTTTIRSSKPPTKMIPPRRFIKNGLQLWLTTKTSDRILK